MKRERERESVKRKGVNEWEREKETGSERGIKEDAVIKSMKYKWRSRLSYLKNKILIKKRHRTNESKNYDLCGYSIFSYQILM